MNNENIQIYTISDTHGRNHELEKLIKSGISGDIFIHAGDFTSYNKRDHIKEFINLMSQLNFKHKIVIPGNHEILLDGTIAKDDLKGLGFFHIPQQMTRENQIKRIKESGCQYYEHDLIEVEGLKIFLSAYTPESFYQKTAFQLQSKEMEKAWEGVPTDIDVLVTHGPPFQILDKSMTKKMSVGCKQLRKYLQKSKAAVHIFGHIHEAKGSVEFNNTVCYNVAEKMHIIEVPRKMSSEKSKQELV